MPGTGFKFKRIFFLTFRQSFFFRVKIILGENIAKYQTRPSAIAQNGAALFCFGFDVNLVQTLGTMLVDV